METGAERLKQRGQLEAHRGRHLVTVTDRRDGKFGEGSRKGGRRRAEVEATGAARAASPAAAERVERYAVARPEVGDSWANLDYFTAGLVAHHEWEAADHPICAKFP